MPHIQQLSPHVADLIAAGEVVERPASVVKELVENAIDAGASAVVVELRRGGMGLIRVSDNGGGIAAAELPSAFLRHATSKLRTSEDLGRISTLGFRGEALAAISAVSRVDISTRRRKDPVGAALHLEGGIPGTVEETGAPEGTTILVQDLFYNTPARLKFMKKDSAETAAVNGLMQHLALSHPGISFKFIKDGVESLHTPGDGRLDSAVYAALGRDFARSLIPVKGRGGDTVVSGFVTTPLQSRGSRSMQVFFVNGRFIKSQLLTAALEEGYRNQLMKGKFPGCVLMVELPVNLVDVNVHPAKTQVKFAQEKPVFDAVYHTVLDCLEEKGSPAYNPAAHACPSAETVPRREFFQTMDAGTYRAQGAITPAKSGSRPIFQSWDTERPFAGTKLSDVASEQRAHPLKEEGQPPALGGKIFCPPPKEDVPAADLRQTSGAAKKSRRPVVPAIPQQEQGLPDQEVLKFQGTVPWRIAGEVLRTYIVCESGDDGVWFIDKHAAHERINFDRLKAAQASPMRQTLLVPAAVELGKEDGALLLEHLPLLEEFGFHCEDFGGGALLVREIPADIDAGDVTSVLEEIARKLRSGRSLAERREELLHTIACKSAIKGGWVSDPAELRVLVDKVQSGEIRYCPHGRPVAVKLTKYELEKMFKRS